nr:response regulator transcription factor [Microlunatus phosphovorus]
MRRTVLIVDDHAGFRVAARALLESDGRLDVVGEADNGADAIRATTRLHPDIVLLDIVLPDLDGFAVCESIMSDGSNPPAVVLISSRGPSSYRTRLSASPACGFLPKDELSAATLLALAR